MKEASPPVSAMATPTNSSGNLVDEFEEAFQHCLNVLTKEEVVPSTDKDEIRVEVEQTTLRFIDLARQMEAFFLQKRFLLSVLKPEMIVKEDISELKLELSRKDDILKRHYEKIAIWQNLLADLQSYSKSPAQGSSTPSIMNNGGSVPPGMGGAVASGMVSPQQAMFMQQGLGGPRGPFSQQGPGGVLQGPLAYLEKTTSNIGMTDGRR
ncbi:mediator complex subunit 28 [Holotrichia oblita]|uniref:Mediator complex subunit 28 n=2 Tax=Holotrichia oblita TaxID=644536 RepID=A0ACB9SS69_HOLOL|nr:mediator complex subunit 28 [Holotrichia oblita]KAI4457371.1 mediator complex subunit 28 [Holotrichia oblita]